MSNAKDELGAESVSTVTGIGYAKCQFCSARSRAICEVLDDADLVLTEDDEARWRKAGLMVASRYGIRPARNELARVFECLMG